MADTIYSIASGKAIKMTEVNDPMFSEKMLGDGVAVYPHFKTGLFSSKTEPVFAPCDGEVILVFTEKHAIGIRTPEGHEILIHMGIETVELKGTPFIIYCKVGDVVKHGDKIADVNWKEISKNGKDTVIPVIWTNNDSNTDIKVLKDSGEVKVGDPLFEIN